MAWQARGKHLSSNSNKVQPTFLRYNVGQSSFLTLVWYGSS